MNTTNDTPVFDDRVESERISMTLGDITYIKHAETIGIDYCYVESFNAEIWVVEEYGDSCLCLTPEQADALADALKVHADAARERSAQ